MAKRRTWANIRPSPKEHNKVDRTEWRKVLKPFRNMTALRLDDGLVEGLSRCLELDGGELPLVLLPGLQELTYFGSLDSFTPFINAREIPGRPVTPATLDLGQDL